MKDIYRYPNGGYEFTVVRKQDILETIDANITDKEVMYEMIEQLEIDAFNHLKAGHWTGIPFLGSIKIPEGIKMNNTPEQKELLDEAFQTMDRNEYICFRRQLAKSNDQRIRENKIYKSKAQIVRLKNKNLSTRLFKAYSYEQAIFILYSLYMIKEAEHYPDYDN